MEHEPIKSPVGKKTTVIWKAYQEVLDELRSLEKAPSTVEVAKVKNVQGAIKEAESIDPSLMERAAERITAGITEAKKVFDSLMMAIESKKAELKDVHDLEVEVNSLMAVVATKDKLVEEKTQEAKTLIEDARVKVKEVIEKAKEETGAISSEIEHREFKAAEARKRREEEWNYDFERMKRRKIDAVEDELAARAKVVDEREEAVQAREEKAEELEKEIEILANKAEEKEKETLARIEKAIQETKDKAKKSAAIEKVMIEKSYDAKLSIAQSTIENQKEHLLDLRARVDKSDELITAANERVTTIATGALKAGADAATVAKVSEIAAGSGQKK